MPAKIVASEAKAEDVASVDAILKSYYSSVSGAKGEQRDWGRFLSLFMSDARFIVSRTVDDKVVPLAITADKFVDMNHVYFERGGYFEQEINRETESFGHIAQVFSTYGSRRALEDPNPYARGINSFQLMKAGDRWWIVSVMWESEMADTNPIPSAYLPDDEQDSSSVGGDMSEP